MCLSKPALTVTLYAINMNQMIGRKKQLCECKQQFKAAFPQYPFKVFYFFAE